MNIWYNTQQSDTTEMEYISLYYMQVHLSIFHVIACVVCQNYMSAVLALLPFAFVYTETVVRNAILDICNIYERQFHILPQ